MKYARTRGNLLRYQRRLQRSLTACGSLAALDWNEISRAIPQG